MADIETPSPPPEPKAPAKKEEAAKPEPRTCKSCDQLAQSGSMFCRKHQAALVQTVKKRWFARLDVILVFSLIAAVVGYPHVKGRLTSALADYMESEGSDEPGFFAKANEFLGGLVSDQAKKPDKDTKRIAAAMRKALIGGGGTTSPAVDEMLNKVERSGESLTLDQAIDQLQAMGGAEHMGLTNTQMSQLNALKGSGGSAHLAQTNGAPTAIAPAPFCLPPPDKHNSPAIAALATCGNGIIEVGEECDGLALADATCVSLGFSGDCGQDDSCIRPGLACLRSCTFDYSGCTAENQAAQQRFLTNPDGTATDRLTGLMWEQKCTALQCAEPHAVSTTLAWRAGAAQWINTLNQEKFAGHNDWRLPSLEELRTLLAAVPPCTEEPCAGSVWPRTTVANAGYWSSTSFAVDKSRAWAVSFADGDVYTAEKSEALHVRAVRRGS